MLTWNFPGPGKLVFKPPVGGSGGESKGMFGEWQPI